MYQKKKTCYHNQKGALTVEASFSLLIFIFGFLTILSLCKVAKAQVIIQHAINQVAREMSEYSYVAGKFGFKRDVTGKNDFIEDTDELIQEAVNTISIIKTETDNVNDACKEFNFEDLNDIENVISKYKSYEDSIKSMSSSYENVKNTSSTMIETMKNYFSEPQAVLKGFLMIAKDEIADFAISKFIASPMSRTMVVKYLSDNKDDANIMLKKLGVREGLDGLDFDLSTIFKDGKTINITVVYKINIDIPLFKDKVITCKLNSSTSGLGLSDDSYKEVVDDNDDSSLINIWDYGGERTTNEFIEIIKQERNLRTVKIPVSLDFYDNNTSTLTYVHSMNTEMKSYNDNGSMKLNVIKSKIKYYCNEAIKTIKKIDDIVMEDSSVYSVPKNYKCKVLMVLHKSAFEQEVDINNLVNEIKKEIGEDFLEIEIYYSDGLKEI